MSVFKGTNYVGQAKMGYGGLYKDSTQPHSAWMHGSGKANGPKKSEHEMKKTYKATCKSCGGKL